MGGVLADADYASDPPAMFAALDARAVLRGPRGERAVTIEELILGHYETCIAPGRAARRGAGAAAARAARCTASSAPGRPRTGRAWRSRRARGDRALRVVVGAVAGTPQSFPDVCALADGAALDLDLATEIGRRYAERIEPIDDARGSAAYRRRIVAVEVRRALEALA